MAKMKLKKRKDIIPGGLADKKHPSDFDSEALKKGLKVELEHTTDPHIAVEIAMDHLTEDPAYYDKLAKMEKGELKEMKLKIKKKVLNENLELNQEEMTAPQDFAGEPDFEGQMAKNQMYKVHEYSKELIDMMTDDMQLPAWVQSKLTKIADYIGAVKHFIEGEMALKEAEGKLSPGQEEIASKAPPEDEITAADFDVLRQKEDPKKEEAMEDPKKKDPTETVVYEGVDEDGNTCMVEMFYEECGCGMLAEQQIEEAEYQGRKVPLNKPMRGDVKKFKVYVKDPSTGNVKKVNFGDKNMRIKKSNPARRKSFRARHNCKNPGPKTKARYWSCRKWEE